MTGFAHIRRWRMIAGFAGCNSTVVTAHTGTDHFRVIQGCNKWQPAAGWYPVTGITIIRGIGVTTRLALRDGVVMATDTTAIDFIMIQWRYKW